MKKMKKLSEKLRGVYLPSGDKPSVQKVEIKKPAKAPLPEQDRTPETKMDVGAPKTLPKQQLAISPLKKSDMIIVGKPLVEILKGRRLAKADSAAKLAAEHKRLVDVLESPSHADDLKEAKTQKKELAGYEKKMGKAEDEAPKKLKQPPVGVFSSRDGTPGYSYSPAAAGFYKKPFNMGQTRTQKPVMTDSHLQPTENMTAEEHKDAYFVHGSHLKGLDPKYTNKDLIGYHQDAMKHHWNAYMDSKRYGSSRS